jgi:hypothetical protein
VKQQVITCAIVRRIAACLVIAFCGSAVAAFGASAKTPSAGWTTFYVPGTPASVRLPADWEPQAPDKLQFARGFRLWVIAPVGAARLGVGVGRDADESWTEFRERLPRDVRLEVLAKYPKSSIRSRVVTLSARPAVEVIVIYGSQTRYAGERDVYYYLLKDGVQYIFKYMCLNKQAGTYLPMFDASAGTIRFTK